MTTQSLTDYLINNDLESLIINREYAQLAYIVSVEFPLEHVTMEQLRIAVSLANADTIMAFYEHLKRDK